MKQLKFKVEWADDTYETGMQYEYFRSFEDLHLRVLDMVIGNLYIYSSKKKDTLLPLLNNKGLIELEHCRNNIEKHLDNEDEPNLSSLIDGYNVILKNIIVSNQLFMDYIEISIIVSAYEKIQPYSKDDVTKDNNVKISFKQNKYLPYSFQIEINISKEINCGCKIFTDYPGRDKDNDLSLKITYLLFNGNLNINVASLDKSISVYDKTIECMDPDINLNDVLGIRVLNIYRAIKNDIIHCFNNFENSIDKNPDDKITVVPSIEKKNDCNILKLTYYVLDKDGEVVRSFENKSFSVVL